MKPLNISQPPDLWIRSWMILDPGRRPEHDFLTGPGAEQPHLSPVRRVHPPLGGHQQDPLHHGPGGAHGCLAKGWGGHGWTGSRSW